MTCSSETHRLLAIEYSNAAEGNPSPFTGINKKRARYLAHEHQNAAAGLKSIFDGHSGVHHSGRPITARELAAKAAKREMQTKIAQHEASKAA